MTPEEINNDREFAKDNLIGGGCTSGYIRARWMVALDEVERLNKKIVALTFFNEKFGDEIDELQDVNERLKQEIYDLRGVKVTGEPLVRPKPIPLPEHRNYT